MSKQEVNPIIHLVAGGVGGTTGAVITSPLDVVKTRLQSSCVHWNFNPMPPPTKCQRNGLPIGCLGDKLTYRFQAANVISSYSTASPATQTARLGLWKCLKYIYRTEGIAGWYRGLGPNLVGVAPSRAIYFCAYAKAKDVYSHYPTLTRGHSSMVHLLSASTAGFIGCTITNPIWFIKTRLQLDESQGTSRLTIQRCIRNTYREHGIKGFYRGLSASYMGISETVLNFVIYEKLKEKILVHGRTAVDMENDRSPMDFAEFLIAGGISKTIACVCFYPHEVARTRLRQEGNIYRGFWQTLNKVLKDEGVQGLYRGLTAQLVRAIPNCAIMMCTYELTVYALTPHRPHTDSDNTIDI